jgi:hypothetical protein
VLEPGDDVLAASVTSLPRVPSTEIRRPGI